MLENHHARQAYERFRLQWMIDHGYSLEDLVRNLESMILEDENESGVRTDLPGSVAPSGPALRSF